MSGCARWDDSEPVVNGPEKEESRTQTEFEEKPAEKSETLTGPNQMGYNYKPSESYPSCDYGRR